MKVFITQYAMNRGIEELDVEIASQSPDVVVIGEGLKRWYCHGKGKNWHTTIESAKSRANTMRDARIKKLEKSLERIMDLNFD